MADKGPKLGLEGKIVVTNETPVSLSGSEDATDRAAFLASFTAEEDRTIMGKVDRRFLWLIGMMYIIKNVCKATLHYSSH